MPYMKKLSCIFCLCLLPCILGCDFIYGLLQREGAEEKALLGETIPFEPNPKVIEVQKLLKLYGYKAGSIDGGLGNNTRLALEAFQRDNNLPVTRFVDEATWAHLNVFQEVGLVKEGEIDVAAVQTALKNAGFNSGKIDGRMGPQTEQAVKKFQNAMGLRPDGNIGFKTLQELKDFLPAPQSSLKPKR